MTKKTKRITIAAVAAVLLAGVGLALSLGSGGSEEENKVEVRVEGSFLFYDGPMAEEGVARVKELYTPDIRRLVVNSPGGEVNIGMDLGEWVFDKGLDVEIRGVAFSSAANYVFTAGKTKYLHRDSMVGWHGGITQDNDNFLMELFMRKYLEEGKARETALFEKIGVDQRSTVYGLRPEFDKYSQADGYVGWTNSLEAMERLGITDIVLLDGEWTPAADYNGKKIFTVTEIED